jgi:hypothetical protein
MRSLIAFVVLALSACGNVAADSNAGAVGGAAGDVTSATGGTNAGGAGGQLQAAGGRNAGGAGGQLEATGGASVGGRGDGGRGGAAATGGAGGIAPTCLSNNQSGFAFNNTCDGQGPSSKGCHASCELAGGHYVGCVAPSSAGALAVYCYASCADCP